MDAVVQQVLETQYGLKIVRFIGGGGFAKVYEARSLHGQVPCAVKVSHQPIDQTDSAIQRELENLQYLKHISGHPRIVTLMDIWVIGGYLVTRWELAPDEKCRNLEDLLKHYRSEGQQGIPLDLLIRYSYEVADGIDFLNGQGIYHRDIKPANLLAFWGHVKIGDLGLAKFLGASMGSHSRVAGTFGYLPPEAHRGQVHPTIDLYGLAATYLKLRTGHEPFGQDPIEILDNQRAGQPILDGLTDWEKPLLLQALAPDPNARPQQGAVAWILSLYEGLKASKKKKSAPPASLAQEKPSVVSATPPQPNLVTPPKITWEEVVTAWQAAGAQVGWMGKTSWGGIVFQYNQQGLCNPVPAFRLFWGDEGLLATLPEPPGPFGLDLSWTQITDAGLVHLAKLTNLQSLDLSETKITDAGLVHLAKLTNLQDLNLSWPKITDAGLVHLAKLTNL
ncbi:MAG: protein kinase, partial [Thermoguttaceae bacterium]|nr:protein kinase [Thermoguttaceae bacterium]